MSRLPQGLKSGRENWAVPPGLRWFFPSYPALKRGAKLARPYRGWILERFISPVARKRVLAYTLKPFLPGSGCGAAEGAPFQSLRSVLALVGLLGCLILPIAAWLTAQQGPPTATIGPAPVQIAPPRPSYPFPDGRSYVYSAEWHLITAGTGVVRMDAAGNERKVTASAESSGVVNVIFPVHDRFESRFDPRTFCSLSIFKHSEEGSHKRETSIHFDYARKKSTLDEKNLKTGETKHVENDLAACATDVITGFYYLQSLPLQLGASYEFPISDGKTTIVHASVDKREQIKVPAGSFPAVQVTAEATSGPLQSKGKVWVWYSEDPSHTPVQMRAKLGWGTLLFRLQRIEK